jgi:hypothetical protein
VRIAAAVAAVAGWAGLAALGVGLYQATPRQAGFDLELVLAAGRRWAAGEAIYPPLADGAAATGLFYTYPPPIAQAASLVAAVPAWLVLAGLAIGAVAGIAVVAAALARLTGRAATDVVLVVVAALPLVFPFSIGLLFGNLDVLVPVAAGAVLVALLTPSASIALVAGIALALVTTAKLYPALIGLWLLTRAASDPAERQTIGRIVAAAVAGGLVIVAASVAVGGLAPWSDWARLIAAAGSADLIDPRNVGPASLLVSSLGLGEPAVRVAQVAVLGLAVVAALVSARVVHDPVASLAVAVTASLVVLPVTWLHYAAALIPFAIAATLRRRTTAPGALPLIAAAVVVGILAVAAPALVWVAVGATVASLFVPSTAPGRLVGAVA